MRTLISAAALAMLSFTHQANAAIVEFFEGNNCTQDLLMSLDTATMGVQKLPLKDHRVLGTFTVGGGLKGIPVVPGVLSIRSGLNDEIRSARISSNWRRQQEPRGGRITVFDSPEGRTNDDWVVMVIHDATLIPEEGVCVGSFERNFDRDGVYLERHPHNGLDGKISMIHTECGVDCTSNLTPLSVTGLIVTGQFRETPPVGHSETATNRLPGRGRAVADPGPRVLMEGAFTDRVPNIDTGRFQAVGAIPAEVSGKGCTFYEHAGGRGESWHKEVEWLADRQPGVDIYAQYVADTGSWWNDRISSLKCDVSARVSCMAEVYENGAKGGRKASFRESGALVELAAHPGWDKAISSYVVYCAHIK